jgi:hypothetical protein
MIKIATVPLGIGLLASLMMVSVFAQAPVQLSERETSWDEYMALKEQAN